LRNNAIKFFACRYYQVVLSIMILATWLGKGTPGVLLCRLMAAVMVATQLQLTV